MARVPLGFFKKKEEPKVIIEKHTTERVVERQVPVAAPSDHLIERINDSVGFINKEKIVGMAAIERQIVDLWNGITAAQRMVSRGFAGSTPASSSGGAGTPASTVTSETSYGIASAVGASTNYAREDHTHGSPATPTKTTVGLANVDNTADASKPVSTAQQAALDLKVTANGAITGATKTKITYDTKGLVTSGADATTADIAASTDKNYVTDAQKTVIGNTSGTNTGDQTAITNATLATMATKTYKGRTSALTGAPEDVAVATLKTDLALVKADVGLGSVDNTADSAKSVAKAAALTTARNINGVAFDGSAAITVTADASTLTGTTLASGVTASSLTSFGASPTLVTPALGTPASGVMTNVSGTAANLTAGNVSTVPTTNSKTLRLDGTYGVAYAKYSFATDGGTTGTKTPGGTVNTTIPANAILVGGTVNVTTACTSSGSATLAVGCAGTGGATTTLLAATAVASLTTNALFTTVTTFAAPKKLTGAGGITFTIGTAALTAGIVEVWVTYFTAAA